MHRSIGIGLLCALAFSLGVAGRDVALRPAALAQSMMMGSGPKLIETNDLFSGPFKQLAPGIWGKPLVGNAQADAAVVEVSKVAMHRHMGTSEFVYVLRGSAKVVAGGHNWTVKAGDFFYLPRGIPHSVVAIGGRVKALAFEAPPMAPTDIHWVK